MSKSKTMTALVVIDLGVSQLTAQASEADRNRGIARNCRATSQAYNDGDGQRTPHCQMAIYNKCLAEGLCDNYPEQCQIFHLQVQSACLSFNGLNAHATQSASCPACQP